VTLPTLISKYLKLIWSMSNQTDRLINSTFWQLRWRRHSGP